MTENKNNGEPTLLVLMNVANIPFCGAWGQYSLRSMSNMFHFYQPAAKIEFDLEKPFQPTVLFVPYKSLP